MSLKQVQKSLWSNKIDQALHMIEDLQDKDKINGLIYKSLILAQKREITNALSIVGEILNKKEISLSLTQEFGAKLAKISALMRGNQFFEAFEEIDVCSELLTQLDLAEFKDWEGMFLMIKAGFQMMGGDIKQAIANFQKSLTLFTDIRYYKEIHNQLNNLGWIYRVQGKLDQAHYAFHKQLEFNQESNDEKSITWSKFNLAYIHFYKGELTQAADYAQESLASFEELGSHTGLSYIYTVIGSIHRGKGELEKGLDYYNKALGIYDTHLEEHRPVPHSVCVGFRDLGIVYFHKNRIEQSTEYFKKAIETHNSLCLFKNTFNDFELAVSNYFLISISIDSGFPNPVDDFLKEINQLTTRWPWLKLFSKAGEAVILKNRPRAIDKIKAQQLFQELLGERFDYELEFNIQVNLCELLLDELKFYGEEEVIQEIQSLLTRISNTAKNQRSITTLVILYSLQAKLALIEGNIEYAKSLLTQAFLLANEKGLEFLSIQIKKQQDLLISQLEEWRQLLVRNSSIQEKFELLDLKKYIAGAINDVLEKKFQPIKKFELIYKDLLQADPKIPKRQCRVGVAQIGVSQSGDILSDFYYEKSSGFFRLKEEKVHTVLVTVKTLVEAASSNGVNILLFPELAIDLNYPQLSNALLDMAKQYDLYIVPGSYHNQNTRQNVSLVISPNGVLWEQEKHIPAIIHFGTKRVKESINISKYPRRTIVCNTEYGRIAIVICRDFLDLDLRVELKNFDPPIDILFNPAFTPVAADFRAAHFDARRSIYSYCFFANIAEFGESLIYTPEKERTEQRILPKEEKLIYKDVNIFKLRSERKKWELEQKKDRPFIQSTKY
ncbi:MAG: tetratricopeptide repeat protein [Candidatus Heimdallarchaeota archaeon]|nr:MAG: tetratricopeptide repeat protein [Candidatus Heimdallarchaeota archaeon]